MSSFKFQELPLEQLQKIEFSINPAQNTPLIEGVFWKQLTWHVDGRGELVELWSEPWSQNEKVEKEIKHVYHNVTHQGVTKGWHVHEQTSSQYTCVVGKMQVVLVDVRKDSKTFGTVDTFLIGSKNPSFINIPSGILKAWKSLQGDSVIVNLLTSADSSDNYKYPWNAILEDIWEPKNS